MKNNPKKYLDALVLHGHRTQSVMLTHYQSLTRSFTAVLNHSGSDKVNRYNIFRVMKYLEKMVHYPPFLHGPESVFVSRNLKSEIISNLSEKRTKYYFEHIGKLAQRCSVLLHQHLSVAQKEGEHLSQLRQNILSHQEKDLNTFIDYMNHTSAENQPTIDHSTPINNNLIVLEAERLNTFSQPCTRQSEIDDRQLTDFFDSLNIYFSSTTHSMQNRPPIRGMLDCYHYSFDLSLLEERNTVAHPTIDALLAKTLYSSSHTLDAPSQAKSRQTINNVCNSRFILENIKKPVNLTSAVSQLQAKTINSSASVQFHRHWFYLYTHCSSPDEKTFFYRKSTQYFASADSTTRSASDISVFHDQNHEFKATPDLQEQKATLVKKLLPVIDYAQYKDPDAYQSQILGFIERAENHTGNGLKDKNSINPTDAMRNHLIRAYSYIDQCVEEKEKFTQSLREYIKDPASSPDDIIYKHLNNLKENISSYSTKKKLTFHNEYIASHQEQLSNIETSRHLNYIEQITSNLKLTNRVNQITKNQLLNSYSIIIHCAHEKLSKFSQIINQKAPYDHGYHKDIFDQISAGIKHKAINSKTTMKQSFPLIFEQVKQIKIDDLPTETPPGYPTQINHTPPININTYNKINSILNNPSIPKTSRIYQASESYISHYDSLVNNRLNNVKELYPAVVGIPDNFPTLDLHRPWYENLHNATQHIYDKLRHTMAHNDKIDHGYSRENNIYNQVKSQIQSHLTQIDSQHGSDVAESGKNAIYALVNLRRGCENIASPAELSQLDQAIDKIRLATAAIQRTQAQHSPSLFTVFGRMIDHPATSETISADAQISCSFGTTPGSYNSLRENVTVGEKPASNLSDCIPIVNIPVFGSCTNPANPMAATGIMPCVCMPLASPFISSEVTILLDGMPVTNMNSKSMCMYAPGGVIEFVIPDQYKVLS